MKTLKEISETICNECKENHDRECKGNQNCEYHIKTLRTYDLLRRMQERQILNYRRVGYEREMQIL